MPRPIALLLALSLIVAATCGAITGHLAAKMPLRSGSVVLPGLAAIVAIRYDERGVPHIRAENETDLYRALGFVHAQHRLFQMEMARRLSRGELAEVFGPRLVDTDRLFRVLRLGEWGDQQAAALDPARPAHAALLAYLDGVNAFIASGPAPLEFELLGLQRRPFSPGDTFAINAYLAYSFAAAFKTEPVLTYIRDQLGPDYLTEFATPWQPQGVAKPTVAVRPTALAAGSRQSSETPADLPWPELARLATLTGSTNELAGLPQFEGSNAWVIAGSRSASGKPLLAGDPHIAYSVPAVWFEAHLSSPGFELYGHHANLVPLALIGHNRDFGWSLTMFQNDDIDLVRERLNPDNPAQAWAGGATDGRWVEIETQATEIKVKGAAPVPLTLRRGPHGPIINDAFPLLGGTQGSAETAPIALWWTLYQSDATLLDAMYALNRANSRERARAAAEQISAPGLNVIWANAGGDIGWWAAARLPRRPASADSRMILDAARGEAEKPGWLPFSANPQEENPPRGHIASANHQPASEFAIPGYYALPDRAQRIEAALADPAKRWTLADMQQVQRASDTRYGPRIIASLAPLLRPQLTDAAELSLLDRMQAWDGGHEINQIEPTVFNQLLYEIPRVAMADEMEQRGGKEMFKALLHVRVLDQAIPRLLDNPASPWWDDVRTPEQETAPQIALRAWHASLAHVRGLYGNDPARWTWGRAHTLTHGHPLGKLPPLNWLFDVGPFPSPGGHETPNNLSNPIGPLPLAVNYGPSTRRVIDFAAPERSQGINPVGQSGVLGDPHYADQATLHVRGEYQPQRLDDADINAHARSTLRLLPSQSPSR
jgi:penicillin amidase